MSSIVFPHALKLSEREQWMDQVEWKGLRKVLSERAIARIISQMIGPPNRVRRSPCGMLSVISVIRAVSGRYRSRSPLIRLFSHSVFEAERKMYLGEEANEIRQETSAFYSPAAMKLMVSCINAEERATNEYFNEDNDRVFVPPERNYWRNLMPTNPPIFLHIHSDAFMTRPHHNLQVRGVPEKPMKYLQTYDEFPVRPPPKKLKSAFHAVGTLCHTYTLEHHRGIDHWGYESGDGPIGRMEVDFCARTIVFRPRIPIINV